MVLPNDIDMIHPPPELEARKHKLKRLVPTPNSFFMDVKCQGCLLITTIFSHSQTVVVCANCQTVLCQSTGGKARLIEGCSFRKKVDLSENLSSDLMKQGLRGRTLTLKLKTSCFEVRTRAVTLPNYICSGEDILKHAGKLLKAELPISLRLMGRGHEIEGQALSESNTSEGALATPSETSFCSDIDGPCESYDFVDTYQMPDPYHPDMRHCRNAAETGGSLDLRLLISKKTLIAMCFK